jgi:hypothetical protein
MSDDQFTKLFTYIEDFRSEVNKKLDEKASQTSLEALTNTMDGFLKRIEEQEIESGARDLRFNRLLDWAREVSVKTGIPLKNL